jgi:SsrA-binding protein
MKTLLENRKAYFDYEILESFEAGIELLGHEVKSIKSGRGIFDGSYISIKDNELWLINFSLPPYQVNNTSKDYEERRPRRLLVGKKDIEYIVKKEKQSGLTIMPISMYNKKNLVKVQIAIVRGKKSFDKRHTIKKRDTERDVKRELKDR